MILLTLFLLSLCCAQMQAAMAPVHPGILGLEIKESDGVISVYEGESMLMSGDKESCEAFRLQTLQRRHGSGRYNIRSVTMGGKQYWSDQYIIDGWRIQQHIWTGHFRLLDGKDMRWAWGSYEACRTVLESERYKRGMGKKIESEVVMLLHGIARSKDSLLKVEEAIREQGYEVLNVNYPSRQIEIEEVVEQVHTILNKRPDIKRISFVTHSMGGLVLRSLLADTDVAWRQRCELKRAVMIFPPHQGAHKANIWHKKWWYKCIFGPAGQSLRSEVAQTLPALPLSSAIIVGSQGDNKGKSRVIPGDDDGTVGVDECVLRGVEHYAYHAVGHTYGMNKPAVLDDIVYFINRGRLAPSLH